MTWVESFYFFTTQLSNSTVFYHGERLDYILTFMVGYIIITYNEKRTAEIEFAMLSLDYGSFLFLIESFLLLHRSFWQVFNEGRNLTKDKSKQWM